MSPLGRPIAVGRTAEVYRWGEERVLKLFRPPWSTTASVDREARIARAVHAAGLPVPAVGDIVEIEGRVGLIYERVVGASMLQLLQRRPGSLHEYAHLMADLHATVHACRIPQLPWQHERLARQIRTIDEVLEDPEALLAALHRIGTGEHLCHGDFHPGNIMMTSTGPVIIDWVDATRGDPLGDLARTSLLLRIGTPQQSLVPRWLVAMLRGRFHRAYLERYLETYPGASERFAAWGPVVAAARLSEDVAGERERLLHIVQQYLSKN